MKKLMNGNGDCGTMGEEVNIHYSNKNISTSIHVGDIVTWKNGDYCSSAIVLKTNDNVWTMGSMGDDLQRESNKTIVKVVVPHHLVTQEILEHLYGDYFVIKEVKQITKEEALKYIPFDAVIVD